MPLSSAAGSASQKWRKAFLSTPRSSFSTLTTNLFPVRREPIPKIFLTLSNINLQRLRDRERKCFCENPHCSLDRHLIVKSDSELAVVSAAAPAGYRPQRDVQKS